MAQADLGARRERRVGAEGEAARGVEHQAEPGHVGAGERRASAETLDRDVATVTSEADLNTLERFHPDVGAVVQSARRRADELNAELVRELKRKIEQIRATRDPEARSALQRSLATVLRTEQTRLSLTRRAWLGLARQGGLGPMEIGDHRRITPRLRTPSGSAYSATRPAVLTGWVR